MLLVLNELLRTGEVPKRSNGADCKSAGSAFGGSNPPLSTIKGEPFGERLAVQILRELENSGTRNLKTVFNGSARAGIAQLARARAFQARGRGFESRFPLHAPEREGPM